MMSLRTTARPIEVLPGPRHASETHRIVDSLLAALAALGLFGEASAHVPVVEPHLVEAPYLGVGFVLLVVGGLYLAVRLAVAPDELVWAAAGVVAALAVVGYVLSRSVGLPQIGDDVGAWSDPLGITAVSCELATIVGVAGHYLVRRRRPAARSAPD